ncbi:MAG: hypothetical protein H6673_08285 [Anaerolineales bacterium]|nr:hypothetical protein [Anaerolineales bacterium]
MSDYYDEDPKRRARRRRRNIDDAWGMAEYEDYADGNYADAEDYAAGMVDEESYGGRIRPNYIEGANESDDYYSSSSVSGDDYRPADSWSSADGAVERASNLMDRLNRRTSYAEPPTRNPRQKHIAQGSSAPPTNAGPFDTLFGMRDAPPIVLGFMVVLGGCAFSCLLLIIYFALG